MIISKQNKASLFSGETFSHGNNNQITCWGNKFPFEQTQSVNLEQFSG